VTFRSTAHDLTAAASFCTPLICPPSELQPLLWRLVARPRRAALVEGERSAELERTQVKALILWQFFRMWSCSGDRSDSRLYTHVHEHGVSCGLFSCPEHTLHNLYVCVCMHSLVHYRSKVWGHRDNFVSSMKTHFYLSNELKIE